MIHKDAFMFILQDICNVRISLRTIIWNLVKKEWELFYYYLLIQYYSVWTCVHDIEIIDIGHDDTSQTMRLLRLMLLLKSKYKFSQQAC